MGSKSTLLLKKSSWHPHVLLEKLTSSSSKYWFKWSIYAAELLHGMAALSATPNKNCWIQIWGITQVFATKCKWYNANIRILRHIRLQNNNASFEAYQIPISNQQASYARKFISKEYWNIRRWLYIFWRCTLSTILP